MFSSISQDLAANRGNTKGKLLLLLFRTASLVAARRATRYLFFPYLAFYKLFVEWFLGVELPWGTRVGAGCCIFHGQAIVIHRRVKIGRHCIIRQSTTIGNAREDGECPIVGDHVNIGSNVCIIGAVTIGDHVIIGAGSVVTRNIPPYSVAVGNPARVIKNINSTLCVIPPSLLPAQASM